ncbi:hypothetical protein ElyMa_000890800 [Elysia marginata]|uniref:Uncharacterized protein n=1 Tax=Elysia marginata TaxID=1093978 RepID=A0AAV4H6T2_9GAST|nr:hypothetical protein ElyMa_000890800 [Elysia marginata]
MESERRYKTKRRDYPSRRISHKAEHRNLKTKRKQRGRQCQTGKQNKGQHELKCEMSKRSFVTGKVCQHHIRESWGLVISFKVNKFEETQRMITDAQALAAAASWTGAASIGRSSLAEKVAFRKANSLTVRFGKKTTGSVERCLHCSIRRPHRSPTDIVTVLILKTKEAWPSRYPDQKIPCDSGSDEGSRVRKL